MSQTLMELVLEPYRRGALKNSLAPESPGLSSDPVEVQYAKERVEELGQIQLLEAISVALEQRLDQLTERLAVSIGHQLALVEEGLRRLPGGGQ